MFSRNHLRSGYGYCWVGVVLCVFSQSNGAFCASPDPSASPVKSPSVSPVPVSVPVSSILPLPSLRPEEGAQLLKEFDRALKTEMQALKHRQEFELKELKASQAARQKEWDSKEITARHEFFAKNDKPPEKRQWVHDHIMRREMMLKMMQEEYDQRKSQHEVHEKTLATDQEMRRKAFRQFVNNKQMPPARLWPQKGR